MKTTHGFTLIEMLIGMAILGVLMLAFTQVFGGSLRASAEINARNELISEGQIAQQLIASRLQSAYYVYPPGTTLQMTGSGDLARNTVRSGAGYNWTVGTDPVIAMIVPPKVLDQCPISSTGSGSTNACFTFYAYYPVLRGVLTNPNSPNRASAPDADSQNDAAWIFMEYRTNLLDGVDRRANAPITSCPPSSTGIQTDQGYLSCPPDTAAILTSTASPNIKSQTARMLIDYVQPLNPAAPYNQMFSIDTANRFVDVNLRMQKKRVGKTLSAPGGTTPLTTRIYPRNWN